jgi:hypothetical protein
MEALDWEGVLVAGMQTGFLAGKCRTGGKLCGGGFRFATFIW